MLTSGATTLNSSRCKASVPGSSRPCVAAHASGRRRLASATLTMLSSLAAAAPAAFAADAAQQQQDLVDAGVDSVVAAIKAAGGVLKEAEHVAEEGVELARIVYDVSAPVVSELAREAQPYAAEAWKLGQEELNLLLPALQSAGKALESSIPSEIATTTAAATKSVEEAVTSVSPLLGKIVQFITTNNPQTLAEYALGLAALTLLSPALLKAFINSLRGYTDDLPAAAALQLLVEEGNVVLVDIRTAKEKESAGVPDLPSAATSKAVEMEFASLEDKKLRDKLRNVAAMEAEVTALQVAALKKVGKGTKVLLLDRNGPAARSVAKLLSAKGFGRVYVLEGGFDGRNGWVQSKLNVKPAAIVSTPASANGSLKEEGSTKQLAASKARKQLSAPKQA